MWKQLISDLNLVMSYEAIARELGMSKSSVWDLQHKDREPMFKTVEAIQALHRRYRKCIANARN